jgi:hypothetical protein
MTALELTGYIVFVTVALVLGFTSAVWPDRVMALRRKLGFSEGWWLGGIFYSTQRLTRFTGLGLIGVGLIAVSPLLALPFGVVMALFVAVACDLVGITGICAWKTFRRAQLPVHSDPDVQALLRNEISFSQYAERKRQL